jgi:hypothetical protein
MLRSSMRFVLVAAFVSALSVGCASTRVEMQPTSRNPGSSGQVVAKEQNGNTKVIVDVEHLPEPEVLDPGLTRYVVWLRPAGSTRYVNLGQVVIDDARSGRLERTTPYEDFFVLVTGEATPTTPVPSGYVMLEADVARR